MCARRCALGASVSPQRPPGHPGGEWPPGIGASARSGSGAIELKGLRIEHGSHLCALYENDLGRLKLAVPFLTGGLEAGEVCYLIAAPEAEAAILAEVRALAGTLGSDRLVVTNGLSSGREMYSWLEEQFVRATRRGNHSLRLLGDMAWAPRLGLDPDELYQFEGAISWGRTPLRDGQPVSIRRARVLGQWGPQRPKMPRRHISFSARLSRLTVRRDFGGGCRGGRWRRPPRRRAPKQD